MPSASDNNKRIAKNTLFLYFRTLLTMVVSLFTSRVVLNALGIVDYGLNNVIAGVITLFSFLNGALGASTSRFLTFELGRGDTDRLKDVFRTAFNIHAALAIAVLVFGETAGLWMVNRVLVIPPDRLFACNVIYQFVVISGVLSVTQVPLNATIIAHERMNVFAYIGISDAVLKLAVVYLIAISSFDKLITMGTLNMGISVGMYLFYHFYNRKHFPEYNFGMKTDGKLLREMGSFSVWNLIGQLQVMLKTQGTNILINVFFGSTVNAANAIAYQVNSAVSNFSNNFTTALMPPIVKSYAANEKEEMKKLIFRGAKFSFFLLIFFSVPIILETRTVLHLWLQNVPEHTVALTRLIIVFTLIESYVFTVWAATSATGKIRNVQLTVCGIFLLNLPLSFTLYEFGAGPSAALIVSIALCIVVAPFRLFFVKKATGIGMFEYARNVFFVDIVVFAASMVLPLTLHLCLPYGAIRFSTVCSASVISSATSIYLLGLTNGEKKYVTTILKYKLQFSKKI